MQQLIYAKSLPGFGYREYGCKRTPDKILLSGLKTSCQKDLVSSLVWTLSQTGNIAGGVIMKQTLVSLSSLGIEVIIKGLYRMKVSVNTECEKSEFVCEKDLPIFFFF